MEVAEPEEGLLEGIAPVGEEKLSNVVGGGKVEGVVVGLEVVVKHLDVGGKKDGGGIRDGAAE